MHNRTDPVSEPFPPVNRITVAKYGNPLRGTVQRVPIFSSPLVHTAASTVYVPNPQACTPSTIYTLRPDNGTTTD